MPLVTSKEMLLKAQQGGYAVGAFNAENMEMVKAIIQAAEELKAPVMILRLIRQLFQQKLQRLPFRFACTLTTAVALISP